MNSVDDVLAELRQQEAKLAQELARVRRAIAALTGAPEITEAAAAAAPPAAPYAQLSLYEATMVFLSFEDGPRTSHEIAEALRAGGFKTRSRNLRTTVTTMLSRKEARGLGIKRTRDRKKWMFEPGKRLRARLLRTR